MRASADEIAEWIRSRPAKRATPKELRDKFDITDRTLRNRRGALETRGIEYVEAGRFSTYKAATS